MNRFAQLLVGLTLHFLLLACVMDVNFSSPNDDGQVVHKNLYKPPVKRVVYFVADGCRADRVFEKESAAPFLHSIMQEKGRFGISHSSPPTESRAAHMAMFCGVREDPSMILKGWSEEYIHVDSVWNHSSNTWGFGANWVIHLFSESPHFTDVTPVASQDYQLADLNTATLDGVLKFFDDASVPGELRDQALADKTGFFVHWPGTDIAGHRCPPYESGNCYTENIAQIDGYVERLVGVVEDFYQDNSTVFVFVADHGMSDRGSHGDGDINIVRTPLIVWGPGVGGPVTRDRDIDARDPIDVNFASVWDEKLRHLEHFDVTQVDIAPLIASIGGYDFPKNSLGQVPEAYLSPANGDLGLGEAVFSNARQLAEVVRRKYEVRKDQSRALFRPWSKGKEMDALEADILQLWKKTPRDAPESEQAGELLVKARVMSALAREGIDYYMTYDVPFYYTINCFAACGWILAVFVMVRANNAKDTQSGERLGRKESSRRRGSEDIAAEEERSSAPSNVRGRSGRRKGTGDAEGEDLRGPAFDEENPSRRADHAVSDVDVALLLKTKDRPGSGDGYLGASELRLFAQSKARRILFARLGFALLVLALFAFHFAEGQPTRVYLTSAFTVFVYWYAIENLISMAPPHAIRKGMQAARRYFPHVLLLLVGIILLIVATMHRAFLAVVLILFSLACSFVAPELSLRIVTVLSGVALSGFALIPVECGTWWKCNKERVPFLIVSSVVGVFLISPTLLARTPYLVGSALMPRLPRPGLLTKLGAFLLSVCCLAAGALDALCSPYLQGGGVVPLWLRQGMYNVLFASLACIFAAGRNYQRRVMTLLCGLYVIYIQLSVAHEPFFYIIFCVWLIALGRVYISAVNRSQGKISVAALLRGSLLKELGSPTATPVASKTQQQPAPQGRQVGLPETYLMLGFLIAFITSLMGPGSIASLGQFDVFVAFRFRTVFSNDHMFGLIGIKMLTPFLAIMAVVLLVFRVARVRVMDVLLAMTAVADVAGLIFFFRIRNTGEFAEIGVSLSHFILYDCVLLFALLLTGIGKTMLAGIRLQRGEGKGENKHSRQSLRLD